MIRCFGRKAGTVIYNELKNGMLMSKDLKQETLLESQAELEQERGNRRGMSLFCGSCDIAGKDI
jgi:hypothetical protein